MIVDAPEHKYQHPQGPDVVLVGEPVKIHLEGEHAKESGEPPVSPASAAAAGGMHSHEGKADEDQQRADEQLDLVRHLAGSSCPVRSGPLNALTRSTAPRDSRGGGTRFSSSSGGPRILIAEPTLRHDGWRRRDQSVMESGADHVAAEGARLSMSPPPPRRARVACEAREGLRLKEA